MTSFQGITIGLILSTPAIGPKLSISFSSMEKGIQIQESNLGNQLLRKMGWTGEGGLGKTGTGLGNFLWFVFKNGDS